MLKNVVDLLLHPDNYLEMIIQNYGSLIYFFLFFIIFLETGFVLTPFLPGDSLLFVAGLMSSEKGLNIYFLWALLTVSAVLGDTANYWIGHFFGEKAFSRFIKKEHLDRTKQFFDKYGKRTIIIARFVPIVRTFAPFVAGIGRMHYSTFLSYNIIGGVSWVTLFLFAGYFFGNIPFVEHNLTLFILIIIVVSLIPIFWEFFKHWREKKK